MRRGFRCTQMRRKRGIIRVWKAQNFSRGSVKDNHLASFLQHCTRTGKEPHIGPENFSFFFLFLQKVAFRPISVEREKSRRGQRELYESRTDFPNPPPPFSGENPFFRSNEKPGQIDSGDPMKVANYVETPRKTRLGLGQNLYA